MTAALKPSVSHDSGVNSEVKMASRESRSFTLIHPSASKSALYGNGFVVYPATANMVSSAREARTYLSGLLLCGFKASKRSTSCPSMASLNSRRCSRG